MSKKNTPPLRYGGSPYLPLLYTCLHIGISDP